MGGNTACWIDQLEVKREVPKILTDSERMFIDHYAPLDNKNFVQDNLQELW